MKKIITIAFALFALSSLFAIEEAQAAGTYHFGETDFYNYIWVGGSSTYFSEVESVIMESVDRNDVRVELWDEDSRVDYETVDFYGNLWDQAKFDTPDNSQYRVRLVNLGSGQANLNQGEVNLR